MATAYLNEGATGVADALWSDSAGFSATYPVLAINRPIGTGSPVVADIDQSALSAGVFSFDVLPGATGTLGTPSNAITFDADNESAGSAGDQASARVTNYGSGFALNCVAGGNNTLFKNLAVGPGPNGEPNYLNFLGGTATNVGVSGSHFYANQTAVITNFDGYGGHSLIDYNATAIALFRAVGGVHIVQRKVTAFEIGGNARVIYDPNKTITDFSSTSLKQYGGVFVPKRGAIPTIVSLAGVLDFSDLREAVTPGGTSWLLGGGKIIPSDLLNDSNAVNLYGTKRPVGGAVPI